MDSDVGSREERRPYWVPKSTCPLCFDLGEFVCTLDHKENIESFPHLGYIEFARLDATPGSNCAGCKIIRQVLRPYNLQLRSKGIYVTLEFSRQANAIYPLDEFYISYVGSYAGEEAHRSSKKRIINLQIVCEISGVAYSVFQSQYIQLRPKISGHTGSQEALHSARLWLGRCLVEHTECKRNTRVRLPTRVLQIRGPKKIRLINSATKTGSYACLSYCWGKNPLIGTTSHNIHAHSNDIPWENLPKTYQDAITFTHGLGLEYMWIDSLCILQDSDEDWRNEGGKMSQTYTKAHITLSAASSADAYEGCFFASDSGHVTRTLEFVGKDGTSYEFRCHEKISPSGNMPLAKRGWTCQERLLSNRIIHFTNQELVWECNEHRVCECSVVGHDDGREPELGLVKQLGFGNNDEIEYIWQSIIEDYSGRSLTYPSDRLPAIQGLAKTVPASMGACLAGHWSATLIQSLCWYSIERPLQSCIWQAPSWSWASAMGCVWWTLRHWQLKDYDFSVSILSATTTPKGNDPTGQVVDGKLLLRGTCVVGWVYLKPAPDQRDGQTNSVHFRAEIPSRSQYHEVVDSRLSESRLRHDRGRALAMKIVVSKKTPDDQIWLYLGALGSNSDTYERLCIEDTSWLSIDSRIRRRKIYTSLEREMVVTVV